MNDFLDFLAHNKKLWIPPILIFAALVIWLATRSGEVPSDPFGYRAD